MAVLTPAYLAGGWTVRRSINGDRDAFTGTATFQRDGADLVWRERGRLRLDGYDGSAGRTYLIGGDPPWVRFDDGRAFHPLRPGDLEHLCGPDTYRGVWTVDGPDRFTVAWTVTGPGRDDLIVGDYQRSSASGEIAEGSRDAVTRWTR